LPARIAGADSLYGKEGVSGSSPEEGSAKTPEIRVSLFGTTYFASNVRWVWSLQSGDGIQTSDLQTLSRSDAAR
jgi:hypothetical protein